MLCCDGGMPKDMMRVSALLRGCPLQKRSYSCTPRPGNEKTSTCSLQTFVCVPD